MGNEIIRGLANELAELKRKLRGAVRTVEDVREEMRTLETKLADAARNAAKGKKPHGREAEGEGDEGEGDEAEGDDGDPFAL